MASGLDDLAALLVGGPSQQALAEDDPYLGFQAIPDQLGGLILGANARDQATGKPQFSTKDRIIGGLLTGLLSGGAKSLSDDYQSRATDAYTGVLNSMLGGGEVAKPDVLPESLFRDAQKQATIFKVVQGLKDRAATQEYDLTRAGKVQDALLSAGYVTSTDESGKPKVVKIDALDPTEQVRLKKIAEIKAENEAYGGGIDENPNSPQYKLTKDKETDLENIRKEFQGQQTYKDFVVSEKGYRSLLKAIEDPYSTSDLELVRGAIQAIEPGMAVREGEAAAAEKSGSIPDQWKAAINKSLTGGTGLAPEIREGILRIAQRRYDEQARAFNIDRESYLTQAERKKLPNPSEISTRGPASFSDDLMKELRSAPSQKIITAPDGRRILIK